MSAQETDPKPNEKSGVGGEKPLPEKAEVAGRKQSFLTCVNCGAGNYYNPTWSIVTCWRCGWANYE
jgi:hypothetical protein